MADKWFISDTHFCHENILKFKDDKGQPIRPFTSLSDMHETIVDNWNRLVKDGDYVYHLGDVTFKYDGTFNNIMSRLKGKKRLIIGNHDKLMNPNLFRWFEKAMLWHGFKEFNFTAVHIPLNINQLRDGNYCVHGHIHQNLMTEPGYINVCVEHTGYAPVNIDEIYTHTRT